MGQQDKSKYKMAGSIKALMERMPLDRITVTHIVAECGLTRQTFYRNFKDKYDLVNWYFERLVEKSFEEMGVSLSLKEGLTRKFQFIQEEQVFFACAFRSHDYNSLIKYDYEYIYRFYRNILRKKLERELDEDVEFLLRMYCRGSVQMTVEWVLGGMKQKPEKLADLLIDALPGRLNTLLSFLDEHSQTDEEEGADA